LPIGLLAWQIAPAGLSQKPARTKIVLIVVIAVVIAIAIIAIAIIALAIIALVMSTGPTRRSE
jgi:hypothetical protein